jgi:hypothetical protein
MDSRFFLAMCKAFKLPEPTAEVRFHPTRRWRFDWAWESSRVALEINGPRLDLPEEFIPNALAAGCKFTLGSDAHSEGGLGMVDYAVDIARRSRIPYARLMVDLPEGV